MVVRDPGYLSLFISCGFVGQCSRNYSLSHLVNVHSLSLFAFLEISILLIAPYYNALIINNTKFVSIGFYQGT